MVKVKSKSEHVAPLLMRLKWFLSSSGKSQRPSWVKEGLHHLPLSTAPTSHLITSPIVRVAGASSLGAGWGLPTLEPRATKYKSPWRQWARLVLGRKNKGQVDQMALHVHGIWKQKEALLWLLPEGLFCVSYNGLHTLLEMNIRLRCYYIKKIKGEFQWLIGPTLVP